MAPQAPSPRQAELPNQEALAPDLFRRAGSEPLLDSHLRPHGGSWGSLTGALSVWDGKQASMAELYQAGTSLCEAQQMQGRPLLRIWLHHNLQA